MGRQGVENENSFTGNQTTAHHKKQDVHTPTTVVVEAAASCPDAPEVVRYL